MEERGLEAGDREVVDLRLATRVMTVGLGLWQILENSELQRGDREW